MADTTILRREAVFSDLDHGADRRAEARRWPILKTFVFVVAVNTAAWLVVAAAVFEIF